MFGLIPVSCMGLLSQTANTLYVASCIGTRPHILQLIANLSHSGSSSGHWQPPAGLQTETKSCNQHGSNLNHYQASFTNAVSHQLRRGIHSTCFCQHGGSSSGSDESISVTFIDKDGKEYTVKAPIGKNMLEVAHENEIDLEGACEGSLACSTCHVVVEEACLTRRMYACKSEDYFKRMPEPTDDELDMLDLAFQPTELSRLGCQIIAAKELDGLRVRIPSATRNMYVDGHKPKPH